MKESLQKLTTQQNQLLIFRFNFKLEITLKINIKKLIHLNLLNEIPFKIGRQTKIKNWEFAFNFRKEIPFRNKSEKKSTQKLNGKVSARGGGVCLARRDSLGNGKSRRLLLINRDKLFRQRSLARPHGVLIFWCSVSKMSLW